MEEQNSYTEVSTEGWGSRIMGSIKSVLIGILLFLVSFVVLWWNEGRAVKTAKGLEEGASSVVSINSDPVTSDHSGQLVHMSGVVNTPQNLKDPDFNVDVNAIKLRRRTEMYQWVEEKESKKEKQIGGSEKTTTTYNYKKEWSSQLNNSGDFKIQEGHINPDAFRFNGYEQSASAATIGAYSLSESLVSRLGAYTAYNDYIVDTTKIAGAKVINGGDPNSAKKVYIGYGNSNAPEIGDQRVWFEVIKPGETYSLIAQQNNETFEPYRTSTGTSIQIISKGNISAQNMFETAQSKNTVMTWILRIVGLAMMFFGLRQIFAPLVVIADVLPFLGNLLGMGLSLCCGVISFTLSFITIAIAWIYYRPILGISLLLIGGGAFAYFYIKSTKKEKAATAAG